MPKHEGTSKKKLVITFVIDQSSSMLGEQIGQVNASMREVIQQIKDDDIGGADANIYISVLRFSSGTEWMYRDPISIEQFTWSDIDASGLTDMGDAFKQIEKKYTRDEFFKDEDRPYAVPVTILMTDGYPTDDYEKPLNALKNNKWYNNSIKAAIAIGSNASKDPLVKFVGSSEGVFEVHNKDQLAKMIRVISMVSSVQSSTTNADVDTDAQEEAHKKIKKQTEDQSTDVPDDIASGW